ncbi:GTPase [Helicobacter pylori]|nr:GTPase [Helicobacter pylori]
MFFKEQSKVVQQERFKRLYLDYQEKYKDDKSIIEQYDTEISDFQKTLQDLENKLISLKECNIFFKIFHFLTGNRKFKEISKCFQKSQDELNNIELKKENYISEKQNILNELHSLQDGAIIGDGRSDFTLKTQSYSFQYNHQTFTLLDVPGIEGDEQKVIDQISNATQKAHAIFYVTKTPNPPQKGEERKEGTIEKIQKQLDSQTEVWTIFNKPINNSRAFKDGLIDESEKESLKILNKEMKNILGKHYMGYKAVSAQMAFYGLSSALLPESDFYKNKQKFLEIFKEEEWLLYKCHFKQLGGFITEELLENSRKKIIESNCNKALKVVEQLQKAIKTTIEKRIDPMIKEAQEHQQEARFNLDRSKEKFILNLTNSVFYEIDQFKSDLREKMYAHINKNIEDEECKEIFKNELKQRETKLIENIERRFKECGERFDGEIKEAIKQLEYRIKDSLAMLDRINIDRDFNLNFDTDSGIDGTKLATSIGGLGLLGIFNAWNPMGWFDLIAGIITGLVGIARSIWSFFSSRYQRSQQKKEVDKNLHQICEKIAEDVKSRLESRKKGASEMIENLKDGLNDLIVCYELMREGLIKAGEDLWHLDNRIKNTLKQRIAQ